MKVSWDTFFHRLTPDAAWVRIHFFVDQEDHEVRIDVWASPAYIDWLREPF